MSHSSLRSRLQSGIAFNLIGAIFNQGSTFVFSIIAANLLGKQTFGKYAMVQNTLVTLSQVAQLACGYTATKYVAEYRSSDKQKTGRIIGLLLLTIFLSGGIVACGLLASTPWLANSVLKAPELRTGLAIGSGIVFLNVLIGFFMGALAGLEAYRKLSRALVLYGVVYLGVCTVLTSRIGLNGAFAGLLLSALFACVLLYFALQSECQNQGIQIRYGLFQEGRAILLGFTLPAAMSGLTFLPALWFGCGVLVRRMDGYSHMALFSAAYTLMTTVLFVPNVVNVVGWSLLNNYRGQGDTSLYRRTFWINLALAGGIAMLCVVTLALLGPAILRFFGKSFIDGYTVLLIMLGAAIPQTAVFVFHQHLLSQERMWLPFFSIVLPRDLLLAGMAYYLIPQHGAAGLASAYLLAWLVALLMIVAVILATGFRETSRPAESNLATPEEFVTPCS